MKIQFLKLRTKDGQLTYSFNKGQTTHTIDNTIALRDGITILENECDDLNDILLSGTQTGNIMPTIDIEKAYYYKFDQKGVTLDNLASALSGIENTPDTPVPLRLKKNKAEWTLDELRTINSVIKSSGVYVDLSPTDLNHEFDQDLLDELCDSELDNWGDGDYVISDTNPLESIDLSEGSTYTEFCVIENDDGEPEVDSNSRNLLKPFGAFFAGNNYITGITFPSNDNFSANGVFHNCRNLKHVHFSNDMLYKATTLGINGQSTQYYLYEGQEGFLRKQDNWINILESEEEFIDKIVNGFGTAISYYYYWPDSTDHPMIFWTEGQGPNNAETIPDGTEYSFVGVKNMPEISLIALPKDTIIETSNVESQEGEEVTPTAVIDYNSDTVEYRDGVIYLDGIDGE